MANPNSSMVPVIYQRLNAESQLPPHSALMNQGPYQPPRPSRREERRLRRIYSNGHRGGGMKRVIGAAGLVVGLTTTAALYENSKHPYVLERFREKRAGAVCVNSHVIFKGITGIYRECVWPGYRTIGQNNAVKADNVRLSSDGKTPPDGNIYITESLWGNKAKEAVIPQSNEPPKLLLDVFSRLIASGQQDVCMAELSGMNQAVRKDAAALAKKSLVTVHQLETMPIIFQEIELVLAEKTKQYEFVPYNLKCLPTNNGAQLPQQQHN